jgi:hypothetical protein
MAAPAYQTAGTGVNASGTTVDITKPASLADTDVVIVGVGTSAANTMAAPDGTWTEHLDAGHSADDSSIAVYSKVITNAAGEPASWTFTSSPDSTKLVGGALRISGADQTTPVVVVGTKADGSDATNNAVATSITPGVADCLLVQITVAGGISAFTHAVMTERVDVPSGGSGGDGTKVSMQMATETLSASSATGTRTASVTTAQPWLSVLLAVQPPSGPARVPRFTSYPQILAH